MRADTTRTLGLGGTVLLGLFTAAAGGVQADGAAELERLDRAMQHAFVARDVKFLADLLTEDYVLTTSSSKLVSKNEVLADLADPGSTLEVNESSDVQVRLHGGAAVVTAVLHERGMDHGKPFDAWLRYTDTWVRESGRWRYVSGHASRLAGPPAPAASLDR